MSKILKEEKGMRTARLIQTGQLERQTPIPDECNPKQALDIFGVKLGTRAIKVNGETWSLEENLPEGSVDIILTDKVAGGLGG